MATADPARARMWLFHGADDVGKKRAVLELIKTLVAPEDRDFNLEQFDAAQPNATLEKVVQAARDVGMFGQRRVVVVWNAAGLWPARLRSAQDELAASLERLGDASCLILVVAAEDDPQKARRAPVNAALMRVIRAHGEVRDFKAPRGRDLARLAAEEADRLGKALAPAAAAMLAERVGGAAQLLGEVAKLSAYVGERPAITPGDVDALVPPLPDDNIFRLMDAVLDGKQAEALSRFRDLRAEGLATPQLLHMLARELRGLIVAKYLRAHGIRAEAERAALPAEALRDFPTDHGLYDANRDWKRRRAWSRAAGLTWEQLHSALDRLVTADAGAKGWEGGIADGDLALELWIVFLAESRRAARTA